MCIKTQKTIVVFGSSKPAPGSDNYMLAFELGKALAAAGYQLANGGYGGTMAALAQGAKEVSHSQKTPSITIGVTCSAFGRSGPNQWIDKELRTDNLSDRLNTLINLGDAFIVMPGGTGTLLELAACWELMNKHFLRQAPIICLKEYWKPLINLLVNAGETDGRHISYADSLDQVLQILTEHFKSISTQPS